MRKLILAIAAATVATALPVLATPAAHAAAPAAHSVTTAATSAVTCQAYSGGTYRIGSTGSAVAGIQCILNLVDLAGLATDGIYGSRTAAAVTVFQGQHGLARDGVVGSQTGAALDQSYDAYICAHDHIC